MRKSTHHKSRYKKWSYTPYSVIYTSSNSTRIQLSDDGFKMLGFVCVLEKVHLEDEENSCNQVRESTPTGA